MGILSGFQAEMGDTDQAGRTLEGCSVPSLRAATFHKIGTSQRNAGDLAGARGVWTRAVNEAEDSLKNPIPQPSLDFLLCEIAEIRAELGEHKAAIETLDKIRVGTRKDRVAKSIAKIRAKSGEIVGATAWASSLDDLHLRCQALDSVGEGAQELARQLDR